MTWSKRVFDVSLALAMAAVLALPFLILILVLWVREGRPVFYVAERMRAPGQPFQLLKLRTMKVAPENAGVSGGDKAGRITTSGRLLRKTRLDEVSQLWNVIRGDMSFVGPRPPLREYVERYPAIYAEVLKSRPGITGLATITFHRHEEWLLAQCTTAEETDAVYVRRCVPQKARIDLIYQAKQSLCFDMKLMLQTFLRALKAGK